MSDKSGLRKFFTVVTSPIWVPLAAAGGLVAAPFKAVGESIEEKSASKGVGMLPVHLVGNIVTSPFEAIGKVGSAMYDDDKK